jgi:hypothetical protein
MAERLLRIDGPDCVLVLRLTEDRSATRKLRPSPAALP